MRGCGRRRAQGIVGRWKEKRRGEGGGTMARHVSAARALSAPSGSVDDPEQNF